MTDNLSEPAMTQAPSLDLAIPVLPARDPIAASAFYAERLGFAVVRADINHAVLERDRVRLHLRAAHDEGWRKRDAMPPIVSGEESFLAGTATCRIAVQDVDGLCAELEPKGVLHPNGGIGDRPWGYREFAVLDLDGNLITFYRPREQGSK